MAGNYTSGKQIGKYSDPQYTTQREAVINVEGAGVSATPFAAFMSRNKVLVNRVSVRCLSSPSVTSGTLCVHFVDTGGTATTLKHLTLAACSAGWNTTLTFTAKTLETLTQYIALFATSNDKGNWSVVYEYQVLYPGTYA